MWKKSATHEELKILEVPKGKISNEVAFEHMAWHINQYKKHKEFDRAEFLTAQLYDDLMRREGGLGFLRRLYSWWYKRITWKIDEKYDLD